VSQKQGRFRPLPFCLFFAFLESLQSDAGRMPIPSSPDLTDRAEGKYTGSDVLTLFQALSPGRIRV